MSSFKALENKIWETSERIKYLHRRILFARCSFQKSYYRNLLTEEIKVLEELSYKLNQNRYCENQSSIHRNREVIVPSQREFTLAELATYDGSMGRPAYVAINGIVYDVSLEKTWGGATHFGLIAGKDLTGAFQGCHGNLQVLRNLPKVGVLKSGQ